ncbi:Cytosolic Fe-S cluster assembly factor [Fasciola hepatica]|uniref:Cytosolic Fe-S cluster assembly factor n=1 Tax=Fasciola hepatica TaxID=6192 RepID=A0A4E0RXR5_FASHE|nr:Cytosolic Fe-S cluster assembly factor [Fasciola hepatica]
MYEGEKCFKAGVDNVSCILLVISGKGGVGKSTIAAQLAIGMWNRGLRVGVLDADFCGPSIPQLLGIRSRKIHACPEGWMPVFADGATQRLPVISIGILLDDPKAAVIWRGPRKSGMLGELLNSVCWGNLDCLIIDTPPGTSDEHLSVLEYVQKDYADRLAGAVVVSTPQRVALCDVRRELGFCAKTNLNVVGLVENMSGYRCPNCAHCSNLFSSGGAESLATEKHVPFLGRIPIDPVVTSQCDSSEDFFAKVQQTEEMANLVDSVLIQCHQISPPQTV